MEASTASPTMSNVNFVYFSLEPASTTTLLPPRRQEDPVDSLPTSYLKTPSWASHGAASGIPGGQGGPCSSPGLSIKLAGASPDRKVELLASERHVPAYHPRSAHSAFLPSFPFTISGACRSTGSPLIPHDSSTPTQRDSLATPPLLSSLVTIVFHFLGP